MAMWDVSIDPPGLKMNFALECDFHPEQPAKLVPNGGKKQDFLLEDGSRGYALDMAFKCEYCNAIQIFGMALSKEESDALPGESESNDEVIENALCVGVGFEEGMAMKK